MFEQRKMFAVALEPFCQFVQRAVHVSGVAAVCDRYIVNVDWNGRIIDGLNILSCDVSG